MSFICFLLPDSLSDCKAASVTSACITTKKRSFLSGPLRTFVVYLQQESWLKFNFFHSEQQQLFYIWLASSLRAQTSQQTLLPVSSLLCHQNNQSCLLVPSKLACLLVLSSFMSPSNSSLSSSGNIASRPSQIGPEINKGDWSRSIFIATIKTALIESSKVVEVISELQN